MNRIYLLTGGNLGNREALLAAAKEAIGCHCGPIEAASALYETAAWGLEDQPAFLNQALAIRSSLSPSELLSATRSIEARLGRIREQRYGPRLIDIDILFYGSEVIETPELTIPHPRLAERRFALVPLAQLVPDFIHPVLGKSVAALLETCPDPLPVQKFH